jgi:hypothetical protein
MKLDKQAALAAFIIATPFVCLAEYLWLVAKAHNYQGFHGVEAAQAGDGIFLVGWPLTQIVLMFPEYAGRHLEAGDDWWAMPLIIISFFLQWVVWSQLLACLVRGVGRIDRLK